MSLWPERRMSVGGTPPGGVLLYSRSMVHRPGAQIDANVVHAEVLDPQPGIGTEVWYPDDEKGCCFRVPNMAAGEIIARCECQTRCWAGNRVQPGRNAQIAERS